MNQDSSLSIVHLVDNLDVGGLERFVVDLAAAQQNNGHRSALLCLLEPGALALEARLKGIPVKAFRKPPGFHLRTVFALTGELRRRRVQVLHTHNPGVHHYGALAAFLAGTRAVVNTRHGVAMSNGRPFQERCFKAVMPLTGAVVFVSRDCQRAYTSAGVVQPAKGTVICNGIPLAPFLARPARPGCSRPRIRFGTVGRLVPAKAHAHLIEAFARAAPQLPAAELHIYGAGPLESELRTLIGHLGLEKRVWLDGPTTQVPEALSELDVFVFSSISEGLPIVILEALAAGLPIVSTRVGGVPEVAPEDEVAWYCDRGDIGALSSLLIHAANSPDLERRGARAREIASAQFSIEKVQRDHEDLYRSLLNRRRHS